MRRSLLLLALAGCAPLSPTPPFHFGETSESLPRGRIAIAPAGGVGNFKTIGGGVGVGGRVRYGLVAGHEVRAEVALIGRINDDEPTDERPWLGKSTAKLYKLSWKKAFNSWLAAMAGVGGSDSATGNAMGGDAALLATVPRVYLGLRPYVGLRGAFAVPISRGKDEAGGTTKGIVAALGGAHDWSARTQLVIEFGFLHEWNRGYFSTSADPDRMIQSQNHPGGYLLVGANFFLGGRKVRTDPLK
ncbi:MAG TPA: hypothetical protein VL172_22470 [Kofleriaceae bacterium]|jgi:hypothetical protein|nr:hypothetical protein [Kofleriaceae bacterium]